MEEKSSKQRKSELRAHLRQNVRSVSETQNRIRSRAIARAFLDLPEARRATMVFCYLSSVNLGEVQTSEIIAGLLERGLSVAVPLITPTANNSPSMQAKLFNHATRLTPNRLGIDEPVDAPTVPASDIDLVVVPALGVSLTGQRIGKGKGFYDAFLSGINATRLCICPERRVVRPFQTEPHDMRMDLVVTERRVVRIV